MSKYRKERTFQGGSGRRIRGFGWGRKPLTTGPSWVKVTNADGSVRWEPPYTSAEVMVVIRGGNPRRSTIAPPKAA